MEAKNNWVWKQCPASGWRGRAPGQGVRESGGEAEDIQ